MLYAVEKVRGHNSPPTMTNSVKPQKQPGFYTKSLLQKKCFQTFLTGLNNNTDLTYLKAKATIQIVFTPTF